MTINELLRTRKGGLNFNGDLRGNSCITSHRERERGGAQPQQPFTIIHNRLPKYEKGEKDRTRAKSRGEWEVLAFRADADIKLAQEPKPTKLHMVSSEEWPMPTFSSFQYILCLSLYKKKKDCVHQCDFPLFDPFCVCGSPATLAPAPPPHPKVQGSNVRFDLSLGRPCKTDNGRCWDKDNVCAGRGGALPKVIVPVQFPLPRAEKLYWHLRLNCYWFT